jgi:hypothetical protein
MSIGIHISLQWTDPRSSRRSDRDSCARYPRCRTWKCQRTRHTRRAMSHPNKRGPAALCVLAIWTNRNLPSQHNCSRRIKYWSDGTIRFQVSTVNSCRDCQCGALLCPWSSLRRLEFDASENGLGDGVDCHHRRLHVLQTWSVKSGANLGASCPGIAATERRFS